MTQISSQCLLGTSGGSFCTRLILLTAPEELQSFVLGEFRDIESKLTMSLVVASAAKNCSQKGVHACLGGNLENHYRTPLVREVSSC